MQIVKPYDHTAMTKLAYYGRQPVLSVSVIAGFHLLEEGRLAHSSQVWKAYGSEFAKQDTLDEGYVKPGAEFLAAALACAPRGTTAQGLQPGITLASCRKELLAFGDRYWLGAREASEPAPFSAMPVAWEHAFGGTGFAANENGKGIDAVTDAHGQSHVPLPNIEYAGQSVQAREDRPTPAGFGALTVQHPSRAGCQGTYDDDWIATQAPGFAADTDPAFFHCAPEDQRLPGWLEGGERYALTHLHPDHERIEGNLPRYRTRAFLFGEGGRQEELTLRFDTVWFLPHLLLGVMIRHGNITLPSEADSPWTHLVVGYESPDEAPRPPEHYRAVQARSADPLHRFSEMRLERSLIPEGTRPPSLLLFSDPEFIQEEWSALEAEAGGETVLSCPEAWPDVQPPDQDDSSTQPTALRDSLAAVLGAAGLGMPVGAATPAKAEAILDQAGALDEATRARLDQAADLERRVTAQGDGTGAPVRLAPAQAAAKREQVEAHLESNASCAGLDLSGADLTGLDFSGRDLRAANLAGVDAAGVPFVGANLEGANLTRANLREANFSQASLTRANLSRSDLQGADLSEADARQSVWHSVRADGARLTQTILYAAELIGSSFAGIDGESADFANLFATQCRFDAARLERSRWEGCSCIRCDFPQVDARESRAAQAVFHGCDWSQSVWMGANLEGAVASGETSFAGAQLGGARLAGANWSNANLEKANLGGADLTKATFCKVAAAGMHMEDADARNSIWNQAKLTYLRARGANLMQASFRAADLTHACFHGANLYQTNIQAAICEHTDIGEAFMDKAMSALIEQGILP